MNEDEMSSTSLKLPRLYNLANELQAFLSSLKSTRHLHPLWKKRKMITVAVEGNIGSGKSSFLNFFKQFPSVYSLSEPVELWTSVGNRHNALNLLYEDPARWSFLFNQYANLTRLKQHKLETNLPVKMMERSLYSTQHIFVKNNYESGYLTDLEYDVLHEWFQYLVTSQNIQVDLFVYLRASPEICLERVRHRARKEEQSLSLKFLEQLHKLHEEMLIHRTDIKLPGHVLVLDANAELTKMHEIYSDMKDEILCGGI